MVKSDVTRVARRARSSRHLTRKRVRRLNEYLDLETVGGNMQSDMELAVKLSSREKARRMCGVEFWSGVFGGSFHALSSAVDRKPAEIRSSRC